ncbi:MAG: HAD family hydrolase [Brevefilum sp.]|nr:HAD family hydrolase [Brevefilum sp.]MDT8381705.1 HAD family hydrolase [Brevefilum sp.]
MGSKIKAVLCLDIDGTLTDHDMKIHPKDIGIIQDFPESVLPILATGRDLISAKKILAENQIYENASLPLPGIFMNGGASYLPGEKLLISHNFSPETLKTLINLAKAYPDSTYGFFGTSSVYFLNRLPEIHRNPRIQILSPQELDDKTLPETIVKMIVVEKDKSKIKVIEKSGLELETEIAYSLPYILEFTPPGINKAVGLPPLLQELSLEHVPVFTAGDGQNDLGLFNYAVKSFAPSYAHPTILEQADHIIEREKEGMLTPILQEIITSV